MNGDQRPTILGLSIAFPVISILAVLCRFESRRIKRAGLGADDWTILAALVSRPASLSIWLLVRTEASQLLTIGVTIDVLLGETHRAFCCDRRILSMLTPSDSRLGNLGGHSKFTADGAPVNDSTFWNFGKVRAKPGGTGPNRIFD